MNRPFVFWSIVALLLLGLPLAGIVASGRAAGPYLEFPPLTRHIHPAPFSAGVFSLFLIIDLLLVAGLGFLLTRAHRRRPVRHRASQRLPWWGWVGLGVMLSGWLAAWTRTSWLQAVQEHTFCLPWSGYILLVNAWCIRRSGRSLLTDHPGRFAALFPVSALFWWFFEYLNRFVQNWHYVGISEFGAWSYLLLASLAFATVLPAVLSTQCLLLTFAVFDPGLTAMPAFRALDSRTGAYAMLILAASTLLLLGVFPDQLFAMVWFAPLLIVTALQRLGSGRSLFTPLRRGDWRSIVAASLAALACGFFWELWNLYSLARWEYAVPYVDRFRLFAMPALGYGGYLPFGLECLAVGRMVLGDRVLMIAPPR